VRKAIHIAIIPFAIAVVSCDDITTDMGKSRSAGKANRAALTNPATGRMAGQPDQIRKTEAELAASRARGNAQANSLAAAGKVTGIANPKAAMIRPYFQGFTKKPVDGMIDPFRPNLARFAPHVEIEKEAVGPEEEPRTPLEYFDVNAYKLVLIMSGTAQAKALVVDPKNKSFIIQTGTKIGNRKGKIVSITATEVRIEEPEHPPVIKVLEPPVVEMEKELQAVQEY